jgi:recombination protein RecR
MAKKQKKRVSKIAYGVPFGGELEWVDQTTLHHAFQARQWVD